MTARRGALTRRLAVDIVSTLEDAEQLAPEWDELATTVAAQPFAIPGLALPWWRHLGRGHLHIITVRSPTGDLVGVAPFHRRRFAGVDLVRPLGHGMGAIACFLQAPIKADVGRLLLDGMLGEKSTSGLHAPDLRLDDPVLRDARRREDLAVRAVLHDECPLIELDGIAGSEGLLAGPERAGLRKSLARADRRLADSSVTVEAATTPADVVRAIERVGPVYDAAENEWPRLHLGRPPYRDFLLDALGEMATRNQATILTLVVDDEPVAFDLHVHVGTVTYAILGRFDPSHAEISPGHLLLRAAVDRFAGTGIDHLDLQLGGDEYKTRWAGTTADTVEIEISSPDSMARHRALVTALEWTHRRRADVGSLLQRGTD